MQRGQLNMRVDDARKQRWFRRAEAMGLDFTAWATLHLDRAALQEERSVPSLFPAESVEPERRGAYDE